MYIFTTVLHLTLDDQQAIESQHIILKLKLIISMNDHVNISSGTVMERNFIQLIEQ